MLGKESKKPKPKISNEERLQIASKLDLELDDFICRIESYRYTEAWPEDRWEEEMETHPFFSTNTPLPGDDVHPLIEGLQKLKYDPSIYTADDLALNYKEDGIFYLKHKKFRMGVYTFTEGLRAGSKNVETNAVLYNNRSAAQFFLKNYRSSLADAEKALAFKPDYTKARWRAAQCAFQINKFKTCVQFCDEILESDPYNTSAKELRKKTRAKKLEIEREERRAAAEAKKKLAAFQRTVAALKSRRVKFDELKPGRAITEEVMRPKFFPLDEFPVHADDEGILCWPTAFSYPELLYTDFQQAVSEDTTMEDIVDSMLLDPVQGDEEGKYKLGNVTVYYENRKFCKAIKVSMKKTIQEIVSERDFYVKHGTLLFYVVPTGSQVEKDFLQQKRPPLAY